MNFAEQLVYWYLRLNGFFPLTNFVLHHGEGHRTSDADLLAVRFPYVSEVIGGADKDWDARFWKRWHIDLTSETVGLIVEVKSGFFDYSDLNHPDREWRVRDSLRRLGMVPPSQLEQAVEELRRAPCTRLGGCRTAKLLVSSGNIPNGAPWLHVELRLVDKFVRRRMKTYSDRKYPDRLFFAGDLIQYLAWKSGG